MIRPAAGKEDRGLDALGPKANSTRLRLSQADMQSPIVLKLMQALIEEREDMRVQNDHPMDIATTTMLRGEIRFITRMLALTDEVGQASRQSEPTGPSLQPRAGANGSF